MLPAQMLKFVGASLGNESVSLMARHRKCETGVRLLLARNEMVVDRRAVKQATLHVSMSVTTSSPGRSPDGD